MRVLDDLTDILLVVCIPVRRVATALVVNVNVRSCEKRRNG